MKILVCEDDFVGRKLLNKFLSRFGECDMAVNGLEALEAFELSVKENNPYDLICLDIMMPMVDGITVIKSIREMENKKKIPPENRVKAIMLTALSDPGNVNKAEQYGCLAYMTKPIDLAKLEGIVSSLQ